MQLGKVRVASHQACCTHLILGFCTFLSHFFKRQSACSVGGTFIFSTLLLYCCTLSQQIIGQSRIWKLGYSIELGQRETAQRVYPEQQRVRNQNGGQPQYFGVLQQVGQIPLFFCGSAKPLQWLVLKLLWQYNVMVQSKAWTLTSRLV